MQDRTGEALVAGAGGGSYSLRVCTLAVYVRQSREFPILLAANRDEFYERPAAEPRQISASPWVVAGQDLNAGGTWLGVNEAGLIAVLLNRRNPDGPDPRRLSRGLLCLELLQAGDLAAALRLLGERRAADYNWFNLLLADAGDAWVAHADHDRIRPSRLAPGVHLLTNRELNDPTCARISCARELFEAAALPRREGDLPAFVETVREILSLHVDSAGSPPEDPLDAPCIHTAVYGTRSSAVVAGRRGGSRLRLWFASGPPCRTPYAEIALPGAAT